MCLNFSCYRVRLHRRPHKNLCRDLCGTEMEVPWWAVQRQQLWWTVCLPPIWHTLCITVITDTNSTARLFLQPCFKIIGNFPQGRWLRVSAYRYHMTVTMVIRQVIGVANIGARGPGPKHFSLFLELIITVTWQWQSNDMQTLPSRWSIRIFINWRHSSTLLLSNLCREITRYICWLAITVHMFHCN